MRKIKYSPDAADKLRELSSMIARQHDTDLSRKIIKKITSAINSLCSNERKEPAVSKMFNVSSDYRYLFICKNYIFYRIEENDILIVNIYHERDNFMWQLFGIETTSQETKDYWDVDID